MKPTNERALERKQELHEFLRVNIHSCLSYEYERRLRQAIEAYAHAASLDAYNRGFLAGANEPQNPLRPTTSE